MMNTDCPKCGGTVYTSRDTSSGEIVTRAICVKCGWEQSRREGPATWRVMHDYQNGRGLKEWIKKLWR